MWYIKTYKNTLIIIVPALNNKVVYVFKLPKTALKSSNFLILEVILNKSKLSTSGSQKKEDVSKNKKKHS